jgi:hypothetical protein
MKKRLVLTFFVLIGICWNVSAQRGSDSVEGAIEIVGAHGEVVASFTNAHALVIGEVEYTDPTWIRLPGVKEDVVAVKRLFQEQGFNVVTIEDANSRNLRSGITNFLDTYAYNQNARIIVYFAGHGATVDLGGRRMGYIVPVDAPPESSNSDFLQTAIPMTQFETWAKQYTSRHILFIFDSCFAGTVFRSRGSLSPAINRLINQPVRQFITSGDANEKVPDESIFRRELENALRNAAADANNDGYVSGTELGLYLYDRVSNYMNGRQNPRIGKLNDTNLDKGDFIFEVSSDHPIDLSGGTQPPPQRPDPTPVLEPVQGTREFFIGTWFATTVYNNSYDSYRISFLSNGRCNITLTNENGEQETTGNWSWNRSQSTFTVTAVFRNTSITYVQNINWVSRVGFIEDDNYTFNILGRSATNGPQLRITFCRE